jgi:hypothetical protein
VVLLVETPILLLDKVTPRLVSMLLTLMQSLRRPSLPQQQSQLRKEPS